MDDLKKLTVPHLRELARKHFGRGHSKLKTKAQLIAALKALLAAPSQRKQSARAKRAAKPSVLAKITTFVRGEKGTVKAEGHPQQRSTTPGSNHLRQREAEPLIEGFFIARVAGEDEARRHHLTEASARVSALRRTSEGAPDLPMDNGDDRVHALARDPETLFVFWDFPAALRERTARGLKSPRAVLRVFEGEQLVRETEFAPESRSFYLHHLSPGHRYRVEAHYVGVDRESRKMGKSSSTVELPRSAPSRGEARFMRLPWKMDLRQINENLSASGVEFRIVDAYRAVALAANLGPAVRPRDASSDRRGWLSPSGQP